MDVKASVVFGESKRRAVGDVDQESELLGCVECNLYSAPHVTKGKNIRQGVWIKPDGERTAQTMIGPGFGGCVGPAVGVQDEGRICVADVGKKG